MSFERMEDAVGRAVRLVQSDDGLAILAKALLKQARQPLVAVKEKPDMPRPRDAAVDRRERVNRHDSAYEPCGGAQFDQGAKRVVERPIERLAARALLWREAAVARNGRKLAHRDDGIGCRGCAVEIDHEARNRRISERRIEQFREAARDAEGTRIPGDVAFEFGSP